MLVQGIPIQVQKHFQGYPSTLVQQPLPQPILSTPQNPIQSVVPISVQNPVTSSPQTPTPGISQVIVATSSQVMVQLITQTIPQVSNYQITSTIQSIPQILMMQFSIPCVQTSF